MVQMGTGDVLLCASGWPGNPSETMATFHAPPREAPAGTEATAGDLESAGPAAVAIEFTSVESIDVLIDILTRIRQQFVPPTAAGPLPSDLISEWHGASEEPQFYHLRDDHDTRTWDRLDASTWEAALDLAEIETEEGDDESVVLFVVESRDVDIRALMKRRDDLRRRLEAEDQEKWRQKAERDERTTYLRLKAKYEGTGEQGR
jgi:hypothetical protein